MRSARNASPYEALCCALIGCFRYLFQTEPPAKFEIIEEVTSKYVKIENEVLFLLLFDILDNTYFHKNKIHENSL